MPAYVPKEKIRRIEGCRAKGLSIRKTAKLAEVGRNVVRQVFRAERCDYESTCRDQMPDEVAEQHDGDHATDAVRCPGCGAKVIMPCVLCTLEEVRSMCGALPVTEPVSPLLWSSDGIGLVGDARKRYEALRAEKERKARAEKNEGA